MRQPQGSWRPALLALALVCASEAVAGTTERQASPVTAALPGAAPAPDTLLHELEGQRQKRGASYRPRTRHLTADGWARFSNRLFRESSPYLLQHAHNPVNWYPWGDEAFADARARGVPVLLSIGYSTCHWCHVMEEESFEDLEIAKAMNESYVAIKVDREERPDIDAIYMSAVQALTGRGGWPMTVWLTPDRKPFFGGTYFPPRDGARGARVGFLSLLGQLKERYDADPEHIAETADQLVAAVRTRLAPEGGSATVPDVEALANGVRQAQSRFDPVSGGASGAPKFPSSLPVRLLLRHHRRTGDPASLKASVVTLDKMAAGGIYDQAAGGFHRYSTDAEWLVPHFEKMLYDNALLTMAYLDGYQAVGEERYATVAREILRYVERDMTAPGGAFYSATDADSLTPTGEREEGYFFTWTPGEQIALLGEKRARIVGAYYGVTASGNFEGRSILSVPRPLPEVARELALTTDEVWATVQSARDQLYSARGRRPLPIRDEKILASWNGLMISAHARAALVLGDERYARSAARAADFVLSSMRVDGRLRRTFMDGVARHSAYLDDYAFLIAGLLDLFEATSEPRWLERAIELDAVLGTHHEDTKSGGFYMTSADHEELLAREKPAYDGAEPSGNSVAVMNLLRLYELTTRIAYRQRAERALGAFHGILTRAPLALSEMLLGLESYHDAAKEILIVLPAEGGDAGPLLARLRVTFVPNRVLVVVAAGKPLVAMAALVPWVEGKGPRKGKATAYVCEEGVCKLPTSDPQVFADQLLQVEPLGRERD